MDKQYQVERLVQIVKIIETENTVRVEDLAVRFNVSENTIRRDLNTLAEKEKLERTQGGAVSLSKNIFESSFEDRKEKNRNIKALIADKAASYIKKGDTIILDGGTTNTILAEKIKEMDHLTVLTNSLDIANILIDARGITLVISGGILNSNSRTATGIPAESFFTSVNADKLFLGVTALSTDKGLSDQNMLETPIKKKMIEQADKVFILADCTKFNKTAFSPIGDFSIADTIITDCEPDFPCRKSIEAKGVELIICG